MQHAKALTSSLASPSLLFLLNRWYSLKICCNCLIINDQWQTYCPKVCLMKCVWRWTLHFVWRRIWLSCLRKLIVIIIVLSLSHRSECISRSACENVFVCQHVRAHPLISMSEYIRLSECINAIVCQHVYAWRQLTSTDVLVCACPGNVEVECLNSLKVCTYRSMVKVGHVVYSLLLVHLQILHIFAW